MSWHNPPKGFRQAVGRLLLESGGGPPAEQFEELPAADLLQAEVEGGGVEPWPELGRGGDGQKEGDGLGRVVVHGYLANIPAMGRCPPRLTGRS